MTDAPLLTKAIMDSWNPWDMPEPSLPTLASAIRENSDAAHSTVDQMPNTSWGGQARDAANWRAADQSSWAKKVAAGIDDLQVALTDAAEAIGSSQAAVNGALLGATLQRCFLISDTDPSWAMRYVPKEDDDLTPAEIAERERQMTSFVKSKADELATTAADHAALIKGAVDALGIVAPPSLTISAQDGRRDAGMAENGWTDEEAAFVGRNLRAAGLTEDQIQRLLNGEKLTDVPVSVQEYLHMFYGNLNSDELFGLKSKFDGMGTPDGASWSRALGQGLVTLSNENVGNNTGYQYLPGWVQDWAENRASDGATLRYQDVPFAGLVGNSGGVPPGERLGAELIRRSSAGASRDIGGEGQRPEVAYGAFNTDPDELRRLYEATIRQFLEVGTRNHESAAAILTGEYTDGTKLADYDRDSTVGNLMRHDWSDHGDSAGNLVDWIRDYGGSGNPTNVALADRAFSGLFEYTTSTGGDNTFSDLMNANSSGDAIGKINPHLAGALREASLPYLNILAGGDSAVYGHSGFDPDIPPDEMQRRTARLFTLIAGDNTYGAPTAENPDGTGAGADLYRDILDQTVRNGALAGEMFPVDPDRARALAELSANLRSLGQSGLFGAEYDLQMDEDAKSDEDNAAGAKVRNIVASASAGLTAIPHPVPVGIGAAGTAVSPWLLPSESAGDIPFRPPTETGFGGTASEDELHLVYGALSALDGPASTDPKAQAWYQPNGQLKPLSTILSEHDGDTGALLSAMERALGPDSALVESMRAGTSTGNAQGTRYFDPTDPDNYDDMLLNGHD